MRQPVFSHLISSLAILCFALSARAQAPVAKPSVASFSSEPYVLKSASTVIEMHADGTGTRLQTYSIALQSEAALRQFEVVSLMYASKSEKAEIVYARAVHSDGSVQETPVSGVIDQPAPVTQQAPFYSDIQVKQLPIKSLRLGDTLEWQARFVDDRPEAPGQFWGQETFMKDAVILDQSFELRVPATKPVTVWTNPRAGVKPTESQADGWRIYRWDHSDLKPTVGAEAEAAKLAEQKRLRTPEEEVDAVKGELPSIAWTTFPDWASVGAWYRSLSADRAVPDAAIKAKVAELTAGKTTDLDKAQSVYSYVSMQIRYIGVAFGIGRYQPHTASEVFANQYGDCKDKHTLLAAMLAALNLPSDAVLVGAGVRFNPAVPSPAAFNHLITRVSLAGKPVFLDATAEVGGWGALLNVIRDQDALVIPATGVATVLHTPIDLPYPQLQTLSVVGALDDSLTSESKIVLTFHDDNELYLRAALHGVSPANYSVFVQNLMANMGFGGTTSDAEIDHLDDPTQPIVISFHYHRVKEKDWGDNRITAIFDPIGLPGFTPDKPPVSAIQLGAPRTEVSTVEMKLPKGWSIEAPGEVHARTPYVTCDVTYHVKDGTIFAERKLVVLRKQVPVSDYKQYQTWYDASDASGVPYIQLYPHPKDVTIATADTPVASASGPGASARASDPKAADLVQSAYTSIKNLDLDAARKSLDDARAINPTQRGLWLGYAEIANSLGKPADTEAALHTELGYHPEEAPIYKWLVQIQLREGEGAAALDTLHTWVAIAPSSPEAAIDLAQHLQFLKRYSEALKEAQDGIARLSGSASDITPLRLVVADAQIGLGKPKQAGDGVAPLLATVTDPIQINNIAYVLAETGVHLPEAEAAQAKIIAKLEADSSSWSLSDAPGPLFLKQSMMAAEWDTMGWVLYAESRYPEALEYTSAALHARGAPDIREHRAKILTALHRRAADESDLALRTFSVGAAAGQHGVASYRLLIADGKVIDSTPQHDQSSSTRTLTDGEKLLRNADLHALFPPGSKAHLVRNGFVNCSGSKCELVLAPLQ